MTERSPPTSSRRRLIIGCGYLGKRVASRWLAAGDTVYATTRSRAHADQFEAMGLHPLQGDVTAAADAANGLPTLPTVDTVLWAVGFDRTAPASYEDVHVTGLQRLLDRLPGQPRFIFISSTGVWGDGSGGFVNETTPPTPAREAGRALVAAEARLQAHRHGPGVVLRLAGLYGPDRLPRLADLQAGKPLPADPASWLNLIHIDDAAAVACDVAELSAPRPLYVVSDGSPIRRRDWYEGLARITGNPSPAWDPAASQSRGGDKRVDSRLIWTDLGHGPDQPNALQAVQQLL
jgi:nucleoside-diphosphate-sugar epimerase